MIFYNLFRLFIIKIICFYKKNLSQYNNKNNYDIQKILIHVRLQCKNLTFTISSEKKIFFKKSWRNLLKIMICYLKKILNYNPQYKEAIKEFFEGKLINMLIDKTINFFANSMNIESITQDWPSSRVEFSFLRFD